jgi:hypothetical protein
MMEGIPDIESIIYINEEYQILICKLCRTAVRPGTKIERHCRDMHQIKGDQLRDIIFRFASASFEDPNKTVLPTDGSSPVAGIPIIHGFSCTQCRCLSQSRNNITHHWRTAGHVGEAGQARWKGVRLQTWSAGRYSRYWVVRSEDEGGERPRTQGADPSETQVEKLIRESTAAIQEEDRARVRKGDAEEGIDRDSSWVKRLGWVRHFGDRDKLAVFEAARWKGDRETTTTGGRGRQDEAAERTVAQHTALGLSFKREMMRCCTRLDSVPIETLQRLGDIKPDITNGTPFGRKGQEALMRKYCIIGQRYLGFCHAAFVKGR